MHACLIINMSVCMYVNLCSCNQCFPAPAVSRPGGGGGGGGGGLIIIGATWVPLEYPPDINSNSTTHKHHPTFSDRTAQTHTHTCQLNLVLNQKTFRTTHNTGRCTRPAGPNPPPPGSCISRPRRQTCQSRSSNATTPGHHSP